MVLYEKIKIHFYHEKFLKIKIDTLKNEKIFKSRKFSLNQRKYSQIK